MKVLLLGATGFTGKSTLHELLKKNHQVTVVVRSKKRIETDHPNLRILEGDVQDTELLDTAILHQDAVINCLGKNKGSADDFISGVTEKIIGSMEKNGVKRFIALSNAGAGDSYRNQPWFFRAILLPTLLKWLKVIIEDKNRMEPMIRQSSLNWTILRFPNIVQKKPRNRFRISEDGKGIAMSIALEDCATVIVAQLEDKSLWFRSPSISN